MWFDAILHCCAVAAPELCAAIRAFDVHSEALESANDMRGLKINKSMRTPEKNQMLKLEDNAELCDRPGSSIKCKKKKKRMRNKSMSELQWLSFFPLECNMLLNDCSEPF